MQNTNIVSHPDVTNRYDLLEILDDDKVWTKFKAKDHVLKKFVVLKIAKENVSVSDSQKARLESYAKSLAKLQHPGIESILDYGSLKDKPYMVLDFMEGIPLKQYLSQNGSLSLEKAFCLYLRICDIVEYVHNEKVAHNNLSLDCILVSELPFNDFEVGLVGLDEACCLVDSQTAKLEGGTARNIAKDIEDLGMIFGQVLSGEAHNSKTKLRKTFEGAKKDALMYRRFGFGVMEKIIERCRIDCQSDQYKSVFSLKKEISQAQARLFTWNDMPEALLDKEEKAKLISMDRLLKLDFANKEFVRLSIYTAVSVTVASVLAMYIVH